jgi:integrase
MDKHEAQQKASAKTWQKTQYANIVLHVPSGVYYARLRVKGKLIWRSLKTDKISIAKTKLGDFEKEERKKSEAGFVQAKDKILVQHCIEAYRQKGFRPVKPRNKKDVKPLKPAAIAYYEQRVKALKESWPELESLDVARITERQCMDWADKARREMAATVFNHTLGMLRCILDFGIQAGARYNNPASGIMRESETGKHLVLPDDATFRKFVEEIRTSGSGHAKHCADLVMFMALGGFRKTEAAYISWADCDFNRDGNGMITIRGHPETGLKNRVVGETRVVPMIPEMKQLLGRLKEERPDDTLNTPVMHVHECQKAMDRAAEIVKMKRITHHDLRHLFATRCIEAGVDIPTVSRWLGHKDGGALAMKVYGHLRDQHSVAMAQKVTFEKAPESAPAPK